MTEPKGSNKQIEEFIRTARALGTDESVDALDRAMGKLNLKAKPGPRPGEPPAEDE